jgi:uncharacterized protein YndB with AHSA1/START domain
MGKQFESRLDATVDATPDDVWQAIATGPGVSSWFVGRTEIDGDTVRTAFGDDWIPAGHVTTAEPPHHFAYRSDTAPDGRFIAYEYLIEGRTGSGTVLRTVTSGFLPGDDWSAEYEAMRYGGALFFATLLEYLRHFPGKPATPVTAFGPPVTDWPAAWTALHHTLGLRDPRPGDPVQAELPGLPAIAGQVYFTNPQTLGIRTPTALYRFIRGFHGAMVVSHELFHDPDPAAAKAWTDFLHTPEDAK